MKPRFNIQYGRLACRKQRGFTFIEVLLALSIVLISLVPLLHLLAKSISVTDSAQCLSQATLIGSAKLAEVMSASSPEIGMESGRVENEDSDLIFKWEVTVADEDPKELEETNVSGLRKVNVIVIWNEGVKQRQVTLSTYIALDQTVIQTTSEGRKIQQ